MERKPRSHGTELIYICTRLAGRTQTSQTDLNHCLARQGANERSKMYKRVTTKSINYKRQTKTAIKLITPSTAQGDAVLAIGALTALLNDVADKDRQ